MEISVTNVGSELKVGLVVYDPEGERIYKTATSTGGANLNVVLPDLQSDGTYYVRFTGTWGGINWDVNGAGDFYTQGPYTFTVRNLDANDEFAGNHSIDDAHPIEIGETYNAVLVSRLEADYFSFTPTSENMTLQIAQAGPDLYLGVALYGPDKQLLDKTTISTKGAIGNIPLTSMGTTVTYYLRFSGTDGWSGWTVGGAFDHQSRGPYTFSLVD